MKSLLSSLFVVAVIAFALLATSGAEAIKLPAKVGCVTPTLKTVKQGNRHFKAERWFARRLHRSGCLGRAKPKRFKPFSAGCRARASDAGEWLSTLQQSFILRLDRLLLKNRSRLVRLDRREITLLNRRKALNRQIRSSAQRKRSSLQGRVAKIDRQLVTIRTKRARINYSMNVRAITRRGAAGVWLAYFDGVVHGCLKAFRGSPYLVVMREHFLVQFAAAERVSPRPTRSGISTWTDLLLARTLAPGAGDRANGT